VLDINLTGAWLSCKAVASTMKARRHGSITVISSVAATRGGAEYAAYCASKAGALGMMRALSHELAPFDVRVNAILPGYLATDMWYRSILGGKGEHDVAARAAFDAVIESSVPLQRPQTAEDLGQAAVYLAGARNVTGSELVVDGGRLAGP
jgi:meso-butanediol dehydrogenase/(S,S)-butanediol dehydrogenase/diacetyl reductase